MQQHPYWNKQKPIHPDIPEAREAAKHEETEQEKRLRDARERQELRELGHREKFFSRHPEFKDPDYARNVWIEGKEQPTLPVNQTVGVRLGRKDARETEPNGTIRNKSPNRFFGRISKQGEVQKSGIKAGYIDAMKDYEKAHGRKSNRDKPGKANPVVVMELERKKKLNGKRDTERDAFY